MGFHANFPAPQIPSWPGSDPAIHAHGLRFVFMGPRVKPEDDGGYLAVDVVSTVAGLG